MPKLPIIKDEQLIKALENLGFYRHRQNGTSHLIMAHNHGKRVVVPIHPSKDISKGTLKAILRDLEITVEEFLKLLDK